MKKIKELLFKQHSPSYLPLLIIAVLIGPIIGAMLIFLMTWFPSVISDPSLIESTFVGIVWFIFVGFFIGAPVSLVAGILAALALYIKKSLSSFDAGLIGGISTLITPNLVIFLNNDHKHNKYIFDINARLLILFGFGFSTAVLTYLLVIISCRNKLFSQ